MPPGGYLTFIARNRRFLAFGFLMAFASSFGQTYFIGVFGPGIQSEFDLTHTAWGGIYMLGTVASALVLPWSGRFIDSVDLRTYTLIACAFLILACAFIAFTPGVVMLVVAIFLLRQAGQGLMSHIAVTSMARYFRHQRGRAIATASIGFAAGEAVLPVAAVAAIAVLGWRWSYGALAVVLACTLIPTITWLLRSRPREPDPDAGTASRMQPPATSWTRAEVLKDLRFYLLMPGVTAPAFVLTAMFFHHLNLADTKGWTHAWITGSYVIYAFTTTLTSLACGVLIDRIGAKRLIPYLLAPLTLGLVLLWVSDSRWVVWPYMALAGINVGIAHTATSAMWAEIYGVRHLGAVRSLVQSISIFATALGPVCMGLLVDFGLAMDTACLIFAAYTVIGNVLIVIALRTRRSPPVDGGGG